MKIKTRLYISAAITLFLITVLLVLIFKLSFSYEAEMNQTVVANKLVRDTTELITLTDDYLRLFNERTEKQWNYKLAQILKTLENKMDQNLRYPIVTRLNLLKKYFSRIKSEHILKQELLRNKAPKIELSKIEYAQNMLLNQIQVNTQEIQLTMFNLATEANNKMRKIQESTNIIFLTFVLILMAATVINTVVTVNRVTDPLNRLIKGVSYIESGSFQYQIPEKNHTNSLFRPDEINSLIRAFNNMTQRLDLTFSELQEKIAEKEKAEEALKKSEGLLREVMNSMEKAIVVYEPVNEGKDFVFVDMNEFGEKITHYKLEDVIGHKVTDLFPGETTIGLVEKLRETYLTGNSTQIPLKQYQDDRITQWVENYIFKLPSGKVAAMFEDTFEQRQFEEQIKSSLKEKETLLHEIHHRVKNNMQVVNSLLKLQENSIEDKQIKNILKDSQNRIYAMSAVHETLYGSDKLSEIDLKSYLYKITTTVFQAFSTDHQKVSLKCDIENSPININQANPIGLVINELISNSMKYAFPENNTGEITVCMRRLNNEFELIVTDDGVGLPNSFDWKNSKSLGLKLVQTLVENQLDGSIDMESDNGTKYTIRFNLE